MNDETGKTEQFERGLFTVIKNYTKGSLIIEGKINSVDEKIYTCDIDISGVIYYEVPLKILINSKSSFIEVPAVNSDCLVCFRDNDICRPQLLMIDECSKIIAEIGDRSFIIDENFITFDKGENDGLVKVIELTEKLNNLEKDVNNLKNAFNTWVVELGDGGLALKTAATTWSSQSITETKKTDIENENIKH